MNGHARLTRGSVRGIGCNPFSTCSLRRASGADVSGKGIVDLVVLGAALKADPAAPLVTSTAVVVEGVIDAAFDEELPQPFSLVLSPPDHLERLPVAEVAFHEPPQSRSGPGTRHNHSLSKHPVQRSARATF